MLLNIQLTNGSLFSPEVCVRVHNEIHNMQKPSEALPSQVIQVVAK